MQDLLQWYNASKDNPIVIVVAHIALIIVYWILARIAIRIVKSAVNRFMHLQTGRMEDRRRKTLMSLLDNLVRYIIYFIFIIEALTTINIHVETLLAGAGIAGLAVGFGAQSLIKDVLTGFFILFEDQYGVGDVVKINQFTGTVLTIGLRLTRIKAWTGEVEIIPNGQIQTVTNYSRYNSTAVVDISVGYGTNLNRAMELMRETMERVKAENTNIVGDIQALGVQSLGQSEVVLRVTAECLPNTQFGVQRLAYQRIKEAFDQENIEIPFPQHVVYFNQMPGTGTPAGTGDQKSS